VTATGRDDGRRLTPVQLSTYRLVPVLVACALASAACQRDDRPKHRSRSTMHDRDCSDPDKSRGYMYPATNRVYGPDDPKADGCSLLVPDHVFCCPDAPRPTDR
jgi:hypothetical protein